jgi:hypothetical protein
LAGSFGNGDYPGATSVFTQIIESFSIRKRFQELLLGLGDIALIDEVPDLRKPVRGRNTLYGTFI